MQRSRVAEATRKQVTMPSGLLRATAKRRADFGAGRRRRVGHDALASLLPCFLPDTKIGSVTTPR